VSIDITITSLLECINHKGFLAFCAKICPPLKIRICLIPFDMNGHGTILFFNAFNL
jgi:hypothetical protein